MAVVPVVLFHAGSTLFAGGFVGVDVFFVISGYLITTILARSMHDGSFSLLTFYERRARRILPALFFIMAAIIPFALLWMRPNQFEDFAQSIVAVVFFASNVLFWLEDGYFDFESEEKPLLHTWSLAVEEQYYIFFPLILLVLLRSGPGRAKYWVLGLVLLSLVACQWASQARPSANFYLAPFRAWELFAGSLCALVTLDRTPRGNDVFGLVGLGLIAAAVFLFDASTPFPSVYAMLPVLGTALVILYATEGTVAARLLSARAMVGMGLISYSAYLWHQPIFALTRIRFQDQAGHEVFLILGVLSFALAWLSWKFVEQPFRKGPVPWCPGKLQIFGASAATAAVLLAFAGFAIWKDGFSDRFDRINIADYQWDNMLLQDRSWSRLDAMSDTRKGSTGDPFDDTLWYDLEDGRKRLLLIGNSHSKDLYNALMESKTLADRFQVARYGVEIQKLAADHRFYASPNYRTATHVAIATKYRGEDMQMLPRVIDRLRAEEKNVILVSNTPEFSGGQVVTIADEIVQPQLMFEADVDVDAIAAQVNRGYWKDLLTSERQRRVESLNTQLRGLAAERGIPFLDRMDYICDVRRKRCAAMSDSLAKHFYDEAHTTLAGAAYFGRRIDELNWFTTVPDS